LEKFRLDGKTACVTGGSRGLGLEIARGLAEAGSDLVLVGRDPEALERAVGELESTGRRIRSQVADVGSPTESEAAANRVALDLGPIDILVNNVGGRRIDVPTQSLSLEEWRRILDLNVTGAFLWTKILGRPMIDRGWGRIINISSISGLVANRGIGGRSYETAKAALISFTRAVAADWAPHGVTVNAVAPGGFLTDPNRR
jgi:gluconate 5-dehydrogenase